MESDEGPSPANGTETPERNSSSPSIRESEDAKLDQLFDELHDDVCHAYAEHMEFTLSIIDDFRKKLRSHLARRPPTLERLLPFDPSEVSTVPPSDPTTDGTLAATPSQAPVCSEAECQQSLFLDGADTQLDG